MTSALIVHGIGGHGRELAGIAAAAGFDVIGFFDDAFKAGDHPFGRCLGSPEDYDDRATPVLVGVGDPATRELVVGRLANLGFTSNRPVVHPSATIGPRVELSEGVVVGSCSSITADSVLRAHVHLHASVVVSHDCQVGPYSILAPRTALAGDVTLGERVFVGVGATINRGITVGNDAIIGAGAAVIRPVLAGRTVVGVPAREITRHP